MSNAPIDIKSFWGLSDPYNNVLLRVLLKEDITYINGMYDVFSVDNRAPNITLPIDGLPEAVVNTIAALNTLSIGEAVEGLGVRAANNIYWVVVRRDDVREFL